MIDKKRRNEILNHYRTLIDQSIANGNSEEAAVESFGNVNTVCKLLLKKENKSIIVPILFSVLGYIAFFAKILFLIACVGALIFGSGLIITGGYSLLSLTLKHFMPSMALLSTNILAAVFKLGVCLITVSILLLLLMAVKILLTFAVKIIIRTINYIKDAVYIVHATKMMKEAFDIETVN